MDTHNGVHLGNILINTHKDMIELNYKKINKIVVTKYEYVLSDYDTMLPNPNRWNIIKTNFDNVSHKYY
jgi:hypothetical protein